MSALFRALFAALLAITLVAGCAAPAAPSPTTQPAKAAPAPTAAAPAAAPTTAAPAAPPAAAPTTAAVAPVAPIVLKFSHQNPPASPIHKEPYEGFMANVEKKSGGRIKFEYYPAEQLVKARGDLEAVRTGVADIQVAVVSYNPDAYPLSNLYALPFAHKSGEESFKSFMSLHDQYLKAEYDKIDVKALSVYILSNYALFSVEKPIRQVDDLKGMRVRSPGAEMNKVLSKIGAQPMTIAAADIYEALQKRTIDAAAHTMGYFGDTAKVYETTKSGSIIDAGGLGTGVVPILMNNASWKKLPPDLQQIVAAEAYEMGRKLSANYDEGDAKGLKTLQSNGVQYIVWDQAEKDKVKKLGMEAWDDAATKLDAKGLPATKLLDEFRAGK